MPNCCAACAYNATDGVHVGADLLETLSLARDDYMAALAEVRTLSSADVEADPSTAGSLTRCATTCAATGSMPCSMRR
jgi:hypothetical protein